MDRLQFVVPARVMADSSGLVTEIYSVEEALDFLNGWPAGRQGPLYQAAFNALFGATVDLVNRDEAWRRFMVFCRASGIAARDVMMLPSNRKKRRGPTRH